MKKNLPVLALLVLSLSCNDGNSNDKTSTGKPPVTSSEEQNTDGIVGQWERTASGLDQNSNGELEENEKIKTETLKDGYDYIKFSANGKCVYDKEFEFEGTYTVKPDKYGNKAVFIYPTGLPATLPQSEKDANAQVYKIKTLEGSKMVLRPAHLGNTLVVYKKI